MRSSIRRADFVLQIFSVGLGISNIISEYAYQDGLGHPLVRSSD